MNIVKQALRYGVPFANVATILRLRAGWPGARDDTFFVFEGRHYSYRETLLRSMAVANLLLDLKARRASEGALADGQQLRVGLYHDNAPEMVFAFFGAALSGSVLFAINTGFRGDTLVNVIAQAELDLVISQSSYAEVIDGAGAPTLTREHVLLTDDDERSLTEALPTSVDLTRRARIDNGAPFIIIYTSGTTGAPKGVTCSQLKLVGAAAVTIARIGLRPRDRGYVCMPLFHSNAWFLGIMPLLAVGGSFVLTRRFSASAFEDDILEHGVTYLNYVGQPIHYILAALEKRHGDPDKVERALARDPRNRFRIAHGNGATPADRQKLVRYLGMDHVYELYGSTEAAINTCVQPGDPPDSVGRITSKKVQILDEHDSPCPPGVIDASGRLTNYEQAVGEICRQIDSDNIMFDGYFGNDGATAKKYRDGWFHSGDLGHVRMVGKKRYLYFNGRTDDWIRKDGENFSASNVAEHVEAHPDVALCAAYGAPCEVSDEKVMAAITLREGRDFDPRGFFDFLSERQRRGGMDPKWMPDYVRVAGELPMTGTQKILVRALKQQHFKLQGDPVYFRERGDTEYRRLSQADYQAIQARFAEAGRGDLLG